MKDIYVGDLMGFDEGRPFDSFFLVPNKQQRTTKTNKPYLNLILGDKTGQIEGRVWDPGDPRIAREFERGDLVKVRGSATKYDDRMQVKVDQLRRAMPGEADRMDMLPATTHDVGELWAALEARDAGLERGPQLTDVVRGRGQHVHAVGFAGHRPAELIDLHLHAVVVLRRAAAHLHQVAALELPRDARIAGVPHAAFDLAGLVAEDQVQVRLVGFRCALLFVQDKEEAVEGASPRRSP